MVKKKYFLAVVSQNRCICSNISVTPWILVNFYLIIKVNIPTTLRSLSFLFYNLVLRYTLDEFCNSRRNAIVKLFIDAMTKGGPNGNPRPIELNSHDPLRYMGDMLAWIHQSTASENEFLRSVFRKFKQNPENEKTIKDSLGTIMDGVCRALKVSSLFGYLSTLLQWRNYHRTKGSVSPQIFEKN